MVTIACHSTCTFYQKNVHFDEIFCDVLLTSKADKPVVIRSASLPDPSSLTTWHTDIAAYPKAGCLLTTLERLALITGTIEEWLKIKVSNYLWKVSEQMLQRSVENTWNYKGEIIFQNLIKKGLVQNIHSMTKNIVYKRLYFIHALLIWYQHLYHNTGSWQMTLKNSFISAYSFMFSGWESIARSSWSCSMAKMKKQFLKFYDWYAFYILLHLYLQQNLEKRWV